LLQGAFSAPATPTQATGAAGPTSDLAPGFTEGASDFTSGPGGGFGSDALSFLGKNPGLPIAAGGLLLNLMRGNSIPGLSNLQNSARSQQALAGQLTAPGIQEANALLTGQLPAGAQAAIDQSAEAAKAATASRFASLGIPGSSMEAQAIGAIDQQAAAQKFADLSQVSQQGLNQIRTAQGFTNEADLLNNNIMNTQLQQDLLTQQAIANLAASLAGGGVRYSAPQ
jgi:hypothetical protein